jgi:metallo-beta-lactamase class B
MSNACPRRLFSKSALPGWVFMLGALAIGSTVVGCGESAEAIKIEQRLKDQQLAKSRAAKPVEPAASIPVQDWSGKRNAMVAPGVYGFGRLDPSSAYAIDTGEGVILIDTGVDESAVSVRESLIEFGLKMEDVKYVLLTHAHYDHVFGSNRIREVSGATVCAGAGDVDVLKNADEFALFSLFPKTEFSGTPIVVDRALQDGDIIELGDTTIHALACPGHTPGSMCFLTEKEGVRILFSGDVIASFRFGPATYPVSISPKYRGDAAAYLKTINGLLEREVPDLLLPGHPRQHVFSRSMKMSVEEWRALLLPARNEVQAVVQRQQEDGKDYLDGIPKEIESGLYYLGDLDRVAVYGLISADTFIVVNAPGGNQWIEWLQDQFETLAIEFRKPDAVLLTSLDESNSSGLVDIDPTIAVMAPGGHVVFGADDQRRPALNEEALQDLASVPVEVISIGDPDPFALAYVLTINEKRVLVTSSAPRNISLDWVSRKSGEATGSLLQPQATDLRTQIQASASERANYSVALDAVADVRPDIWLPSLPLTGQNANLYDQSWNRIMNANRDQLSSGIPR